MRHVCVTAYTTISYQRKTVDLGFISTKTTNYEYLVLEFQEKSHQTKLRMINTKHMYSSFVVLFNILFFGIPNIIMKNQKRHSDFSVQVRSYTQLLLKLPNSS